MPIYNLSSVRVFKRKVKPNKKLMTNIIRENIKTNFIKDMSEIKKNERKKVIYKYFSNLSIIAQIILVYYNLLLLLDLLVTLILLIGAVNNII